MDGASIDPFLKLMLTGDENLNQLEQRQTWLKDSESVSIQEGFAEWIGNKSTKSCSALAILLIQTSTVSNLTVWAKKSSRTAQL